MFCKKIEQHHKKSKRVKKKLSSKKNRAVINFFKNNIFTTYILTRKNVNNMRGQDNQYPDHLHCPIQLTDFEMIENQD